MTLDDILHGLFPNGHEVKIDPAGWITGKATRKVGGPISVVGVANGTALGTAGVLPLAAQVLQVAEAGGDTPILVLVDTQGQLMARRDEMRGLNEYLGHLAKCLLLASHLGHRTIGLEYGKAAAGSFLATALATDILVALPGATPTVMDMPSIARVTKLPEQRLVELAKTTAVFAPGLEHMVSVGAVATVWDPAKPLDAQLEQALADASPDDRRDVLGAERGGRPMAAGIAKRVIAAVKASSGPHAAA
jgi:malonate decarboxylase gamma subunit